MYAKYADGYMTVSYTHLGDGARGQRRGGGDSLRNGANRPAELLPVCHGALFYDGLYGQRRGRKNNTAV